MNQTAVLAPVQQPAHSARVAGSSVWMLAGTGLVLAVAGLAVSLLWDFSWESTVGIDGVWAPPHAATYVSITLAGLIAVTLVCRNREGVRLGPFSAPIGAWLVLWGALIFPTAFLFDRWWQSAYGLGAGIWHPPQLAKAIAFFAIAIGAWLLCLSCQNRAVRGASAAFALTGGLVLALIGIVTLTSSYPNRQHSGVFYQVSCATYPIVLAALARAGKIPGSGTIAAALYMALFCGMIWLLPLFPAKPLAAPVYNNLEHMLPPPFPLLLILSAMALDVLFRTRTRPWLQAGAAGLVFFVIFAGMQWIFAEFLLSGLSDNWFFAGGGKHWPFFLKIDPPARVQFWNTAQSELNVTSGLISIGLAILAVRIGLWLGAWMARVRR